MRPEDHEAHFNLAQVFEQERKIDQAIQHYRLCVQAKPDHVLGRASLGMTLCAKGAFQEGAAHLAKAVALEPANSTMRHNLAITLVRLEQHDQAIAQWQYILQREPGNIDALMCLAVEYGQTGQRDKALGLLEDGLRMARSAGDEKLAGQIAEQIRRFTPVGAGGSR